MKTKNIIRKRFTFVFFVLLLTVSGCSSSYVRYWHDEFDAYDACQEIKSCKTWGR